MLVFFENITYLLCAASGVALLFLFMIILLFQHKKNSPENTAAKQESIKALLSTKTLIENDLKIAQKELIEVKARLESKKEKQNFIADVVNAQPVINEGYQSYKKLLTEDYIQYTNQNNSLICEAAALLK
ncbi:MAG: hypothetical protein ACRC5H_05905, partial [Treponemataceae bacterium]